MIYVITLGFILYAGAYGRNFIKQGLLKELAVFIVLTSLSLVCSFGIILKWNLPVPSRVLTYIIDPLSRYVFHELLK